MYPHWLNNVNIKVMNGAQFDATQSIAPIDCMCCFMFIYCTLSVLNALISYMAYKYNWLKLSATQLYTIM